METSITLKSFMNVTISAFITSYARVELVKMIHLQNYHENEVFYCDTDSVVVKNLPDSLSSELGSWDIEKAFDFFKCYAPKAYIFKLTNEPEIKLTLKGLARKTKEKILKQCKTIEDIEQSVIEIEIFNRPRYFTIKEAIRRHEKILTWGVKSKTFQLKNTKRNVLANNTTIPFNYQTLLQEQKQKLLQKQNRVYKRSFRDGKYGWNVTCPICGQSIHLGHIQGLIFDNQDKFSEKNDFLRLVHELYCKHIFQIDFDLKIALFQKNILHTQKIII